MCSAYTTSHHHSPLSPPLQSPPTARQALALFLLFGWHDDGTLHTHSSNEFVVWEEDRLRTNPLSFSYISISPLYTLLMQCCSTVVDTIRRGRVFEKAGQTEGEILQRQTESDKFPLSHLVCTLTPWTVQFAPFSWRIGCNIRVYVPHTASNYMYMHICMQNIYRRSQSTSLDSTWPYSRLNT